MRNILGAHGIVRLRQSRRFQAAIMDRYTSTWAQTQNSINRELRGDLDALRVRARDLAKNNDYAKKFISLAVTNIVGPSGFAFQSRAEDRRGTPDGLANAAIESAFAGWMQRGVCEISGRMGFSDLQRAIVRCAARDGEYLLRVVRGPQARNVYNFALQLLDVDRLATNHNAPSANGKNAIIMGVEVDDYRRPVAYHMYESHPADDYGSRRIVRIPVDEVIHDFVPEYPEQMRGIPWMHAAMLSLHHLGEFERSALLAARKGADTLGFFVSPDGGPPPISGEASAADEPITVSVPGSYDTLPDGYDFRAYDSKYPEAMTGAFTKTFLRRIASGLNVSYNGLANDLEGVNFSSIRSGVIDERDQWLTLQSWFMGSFLTPVYEAWLGSALLSGAILMPNGSPLPAGKKAKFYPHAWQGRRWQWVDPLRDIEAARLAVKSGVSSPQRVAAQMGMDVEEVLADIAAFEAMVRSKSVSLIDYQLTTARDSAPPPE